MAGSTHLNKNGKASVPLGFFLSKGFASSVLYFSKSFQPESNFRYLGLATLDHQSAYVVAFAQISGKATISIDMSTVRTKSQDGAQVLVQGIAWVDTNRYQILKLRLALLGPEIQLNQDEQLDELETVVTFAQVLPQDVDHTMWLPSEASVHALFQEHFYDDSDGRPIWIPQWFENFHRFTDYQRFGSPDEETVNLDESARKNDAAAHPYLELALQHRSSGFPT
jgi:hypothetical protein